VPGSRIRGGSRQETSNDENGMEIYRTEPHRFLYLIKSNPYFLIRLYRFHYRFRILNVKVENGLDIFRSFLTDFYFSIFNLKIS
jgi:hypothetical protein